MTGNTTHLPGPEERVYESIHTGQGKVLETRLDGVIPRPIVVPEGAIGVIGGGSHCPAKPEPAVVEPIAVLSSDVDAKGRLTRRIVGISDDLCHNVDTSGEYEDRS